MSGLEVFPYEARELHVIVIDGEPWFVAGDVASILGFRDAYNLTRGLDVDEKGTQIVSTPGGDQSVAVISEPGLYSAIVRSRVEGARKFKRWVTHEVLPAIRKTGTYNAPASMSFEEMTAHVIDGLQAQIAAAHERVKELEAPALAWQNLSQADGDWTVSDASKILSREGVCPGPRKLYDWLEARGWVFRRGGRWQAMQSAVNSGFLVERVTGGYIDREGVRQQGDPQVRVTAKGLERMRSLLADERTLTAVV